MGFLLSSNYLSAVLTEAQKTLEVTETVIIVAATVALLLAFLALIKGA
jgi:hypothetical protein